MPLYVFSITMCVHTVSQFSTTETYSSINEVKQCASKTNADSVSSSKCNTFVTFLIERACTATYSRRDVYIFRLRNVYNIQFSSSQYLFLVSLRFDVGFFGFDRMPVHVRTHRIAGRQPAKATYLFLERPLQFGFDRFVRASVLVGNMCAGSSSFCSQFSISIRFSLYSQIPFILCFFNCNSFGTHIY